MTNQDIIAAFRYKLATWPNTAAEAFVRQILLRAIKTLEQMEKTQN